MPVMAAGKGPLRPVCMLCSCIAFGLASQPYHKKSTHPGAPHVSALQGSHQREERSVQAVDFVGMMEALRKLMHMVQQIHRCHASFGAACWGSTLDHIQVHLLSVLKR